MQMPIRGQALPHELLRIAPLCFLSATLFVVSCNAKPPRAAYVPISELEQTFGRLITVANIPTPDQHGTGDRVGLVCWVTVAT